ncbi:efflux transporter outer membrane subunit [Pseudomonas alliivorans]|uniref:efflux transporter outer membrane subunit n=1 Tax=Pseudomonas alliivorans TaxID=2810613 RepID=UPI002ED0D879|nr:efflux transporter outer membrane subunit [Pseudomonas alliivorans]MEE5070999.1 efflux transporter outer membrane subunit [Pseudomonas alliivorans]MEE5101375.1 efflux transporter outer membrane subunit [Pseudomonas alliivorans]
MSAYLWYRRLQMHALGAAMLVSGGCALQPAYVTPPLAAPTAWSAWHGQPGNQPAGVETRWWHLLHDDAIDALTEAAFTDNPTLMQALSRVEEARSGLDVKVAATMPSIDLDASVTRAKSRNTSPIQPGVTMLSHSASAGPEFSWELDLFGRVSQSVEAARDHLDARTADAASTRLTLAADVANDVLSLRACESSRRVWLDDIASREKTLALTRMRLDMGLASAVDEARILAGLATSRTSLANQIDQCARQVNALVTLTGQGADTVRQRVGITQTGPGMEQMFMPRAPLVRPELPATVLASHPDVVSAEREAAAAWADIAVARADRLPRIDLAAALSGQWIRAAGSSLDFNTWSIGPSLTGPLFDGGAGAANVKSAQARYRRASASLRGTLRTTVEDVENALAAQASAASRVLSTQEGVSAARTTFKVSDDQWKAGAISLFELEDARRQFASAQDAEISALRDQGQAWIALVKATGTAITLTPDTTSHE